MCSMYLPCVPFMYLFVPAHVYPFCTESYDLFNVYGWVCASSRLGTGTLPVCIDTYVPWALVYTDLYFFRMPFSHTCVLVQVTRVRPLPSYVHTTRTHVSRLRSSYTRNRFSYSRVSFVLSPPRCTLFHIFPFILPFSNTVTSFPLRGNPTFLVNNPLGTTCPCLVFPSPRRPQRHH